MSRDTAKKQLDYAWSLYEQGLRGKALENKTEQFAWDEDLPKVFIPPMHCIAVYVRDNPTVDKVYALKGLLLAVEFSPANRGLQHHIIRGCASKAGFTVSRQSEVNSSMLRKANELLKLDTFPLNSSGTILGPTRHTETVGVKTLSKPEVSTEDGNIGQRTTAELLVELIREYPNGVSFDPMAVRLLRQKLPLEDWQINDLKKIMFQLGNGLWFSRGMIADDETILAFEGQARKWIIDHHCFSVERLFETFSNLLRHIVVPEVCAVFLKHLGFTVESWGKGGLFCFLPPYILKDSLAAISEMIAESLEEMGGTLTFGEIEASMPYLTPEALESIRAQFLSETYVVDIGGTSCWCAMKAIHLPEDFSEKLTMIVDTLVALKERLSVTNLEFALNLIYRIHFREEYILTDNNTFMRVCAEYYRGNNGVFPNTRKPRTKPDNSSLPGKRRLRSPNTCFRELGVPVGAELIFTENGLSCIVLDEFNQVQYDGKAWAISALAMHLLGVSSANGFRHFKYEGEILSQRRLRLERGESQHEEYQAGKIPPIGELQQTKCGIIGLEGKPLSLSTWRVLRSIGTNPNVVEWERRVENGESVENIASDNSVSVSTVKQYIARRHYYFIICEKNGIMPEDAADV